MVLPYCCLIPFLKQKDFLAINIEALMRSLVISTCLYFIALNYIWHATFGRSKFVGGFNSFFLPLFFHIIMLSFFASVFIFSYLEHPISFLQYLLS